MKFLFLVIGIFFGFMTFQPSAIAGPEDCTLPIINFNRDFLIESVELKDSFDLLDKGDCIGALDRFKSWAKRGNLAAQYNVGLIYETGLGVPIDLKRTRQWYLKAAEGGLSQAQWTLAVLILSAGSNCGLFCDKGLLKPKTLQEVVKYREALMWCIAASENGHPIAPYGVRQISDVLSDREVIAARSAARKWIKPPNGQQKISDKDKTFNLIIPNDWEEIPLEELNRQSEEIEKRKNGRFGPPPVNLMGFKLKRKGPDPFPMVTISEVYTHLTKQDIEILFKVDWQLGIEILNEFSEGLGKLEQAPIVFYEKEKGFIWMVVRTLNQRDLEDFYVLTVGVGVPTKKGQLMVSCHLKEVNKKKYYSTCFHIIKSLNVSDDFIIRY